jgi:SAM-dependent methyltransferase
VESVARYDGFAAWYDERLAEGTLAVGDVLDRLLGSGAGGCLDLCCGTGLHLPRLLELGWQVTGVDISADQLGRARERVGARATLVRADATALPFPNGQFAAVASIFSHTDVDDFAGLVREGSRVLRTGGVFVYCGLHPCFYGPHSQFPGGRGVPRLHAGYRQSGRYSQGPGVTPGGLREKVGAVHLPLGSFLQAFLDTGLTLDHFEEHGDAAYPPRVALRARR